MCKEEWLIVIGAIAFVVVMVALAFWGTSYECSSQWKRSGFETDYGPIQGCLISKDGKTWIPAKNYRDVAN